MSLPLLSKPLLDEVLFLYLAISDSALSAALVWKDGGIKKPVYNVSKALIVTQTRYTKIEKLVFALFITMRKLKHYLQSFSIVVLKEYLLRTIVENL